MTLKASDYPTVRPALDLNFEQTKRLDPRITFSRASTGTYLDANGVLQSAPAGVARFDHNPETGESLGLLMEEARTNRALYSEQFDNGWWTKNATTVTANAITAPDGTATADKLISLSTSNRFCAYNLLTMTANTVQTFSCYGKSADWDFMTLVVSKQGSPYTRDSYTINLSNGTVNKGPWTTASVLSTAFTKESLPNNWWRLSVSVLIDSSSTDLAIEIGTSPTDQYNNGMPGDGTSGIYIWGAQLETGSFPTSYIPTVASTVTRATDVCTVTNSNIYDTDSFTIINQPFGASTNDGSELTLFDGPEPIKRATVYSTDLSQTTVNAAAGKTDEFWRWRVLGSSFALPNFTTDGQVTVDWGDGTIETLTTAEHTFSNGSGYHDIGFRLDSGTYFRPYIADNASIDTKVVALGPAPESMKLNGEQAFYGCSNLEAFDATVDATGGTSFLAAWGGCSSLTSFPLINTATGTSFASAWYLCSNLISFPLINTAAGTNFADAWHGCSSLTSFPLINTSSGTNFYRAWISCSSLTSFPLLDTSAGTNFIYAWTACSSLTDFPANFFDSWTGTPVANCFFSAWAGCSALTATSVENILNSIDTSGQSAPASGVDITISYNASSGTPSVATAITNLKSRGWTITLNGVLQ